MAPMEISSAQARVVNALRERNPQASIELYAAAGGVVVEVRRGQSCERARVDPTGRILRDQSVLAS